LSGACNGVRVRETVQVLHQALAGQRDRQHEGERHEDACRRPHQVDPEVPDRVGFAARQAAHQRHDDGDSDRRREEVLQRQTAHLHQVAGAGLARVVLPVGVGDEADRRVEGERRRGARGMARVEWERALQAQKQVERRHRDAAEDEKRASIGLPGLLSPLVDPREPVAEPLERAEDALAGSRAAAKDAGQVGAEQRRADTDQADQRTQLKPVLPAHPNRSGSISAASR
jgi:hypothetical protein